MCTLHTCGPRICALFPSFLPAKREELKASRPNLGQPCQDGMIKVWIWFISTSNSISINDWERCFSEKLLESTVILHWKALTHTPWQLAYISQTVQYDLTYITQYYILKYKNIYNIIWILIRKIWSLGKQNNIFLWIIDFINLTQTMDVSKFSLTKITLMKIWLKTWITDLKHDFKRFIFWIVSFF